jgi:KaiC/GvpD/RAD55 family RecA-like ATPase
MSAVGLAPGLHGPLMPHAVAIARDIARNVHHAKFGRGRVLRADDKVARIEFADYGVKDMSLEAAKLEAVDDDPAPVQVRPPQAPVRAANTPSKPAGDPAGFIAYRRASDIQARPIRWLWQGRIARGKVSMLAGNPGLGKSQVTANMAAVVTTRRTWPVDGSRCERGNVVFLSAEDDPEDTIRPRLEAAGADLSRVFILDAVVESFNAEGGEIKRAFNLKTDLNRLGKMLEEIGGAAMIVIDPITAYLGEADSHKNAEIRALLAPLSDLAAKHGAAVVCVSHLNKSSGGEALMRVTGSLAFVAAARAAFIVAKDPENDARRLFLPLKNNIGNDRSGLAFAIESAQVKSPAGLIETSRVAWEPDPVTVTADEAMTPQGDPEERSALDDARQFLLGLLADGPVRAGQIKRDAVGAGFNWRTIQRAADRLGIERQKDGMRGGWTWKLPPKMTSTPEDDRHETVSPSGSLVAFGEELEAI